jgi:hypothetical protein
MSSSIKEVSSTLLAFSLAKKYLLFLNSSIAEFKVLVASSQASLD